MSILETLESGLNSVGRAMRETEYVQNFEKMLTKKQTEVAVKVGGIALGSGLFYRLIAYVKN